MPWRFCGTPWEAWIAAAPAIDIDDLGDAYHRAAANWLAGYPGQTVPLDDEQREQLERWIAAYRFDLLRAIVDEPSVGMDRLMLAILSLISSIAGAAIVTALGPPTLIAASVTATVVVTLVSIFHAVSVIGRNLRKQRRRKLIDAIDGRLAGLLATPYISPQLPAPAQVLPVVSIKSDRSLAERNHD